MRRKESNQTNKQKLGPLQIQPLTKSALIVILWENYANDDVHLSISRVAEGVLKE